MSDEKQMTWDELAAENSKLRAEVARLTRERDEYDQACADECQKTAAARSHAREAVKRAEKAEAEVATLKARSLPADAEERIAREMMALSWLKSIETRTDEERAEVRQSAAEAWASMSERHRAPLLRDARELLAALAGEAGR